MGCLCTSSLELSPIPSPRPKIRHSNTYLAPEFLIQNYVSFYQTYELENDIIGIGSLGEVRVCTHKRSKQRRAVKIIEKKHLSNGTKKSYFIQQEMNIHRELDHPNILKIYEYFDEENYCYIVMEHCEGGDLQKKIIKGKIPEELALEIFSQIVSAVSYLHAKGIVHRDLKPENILIEESKEKVCAKIIDFDMATHFKGRLNELRGTPLYMAPEVFKKKYDEKCDIWSLGVILYEMLTGFRPFSSRIYEQLSRSIIEDTPLLKGNIWIGKSDNSRNLVKSLLNKSPHCRPSASNIIKIMKVLALAPNNFQVPSMSVYEITQKKNSSRFRKSLEKFILYQVIDQSEFIEYYDWFRHIDTDKDGLITFQDLYRHLKEYLVNAKTATKHFLKKDKKLEYSEFLYIVFPTSQLLTEENIEVVFNILDKKDLGVVFHQNLQEQFGRFQTEDMKEITLQKFKQIVKINI